MRWALNGSVAMNGREREGWEGVERLQEGSKGLSYTDEWALAGNHRVASLSKVSKGNSGQTLQFVVYLEL